MAIIPTPNSAGAKVPSNIAPPSISSIRDANLFSFGNA